MANIRSKIEIKVISLPDAADRRAQVQLWFEKHRHISWTFFDAVRSDAQTLLSENEREQLFKYGRRLTDGEVGCFKSHFLVLNQFVSQTAVDWLLVLEDDVILDPGFDVTATVHLAQSRKIQYIRLYARRLKTFRDKGSFGDRQLIRFLSDPYGAQAYLINHRAASKFISGLSSIAMPIDDEFGRFWVNELFPYALFPFPVLELSVPSSLETERNKLNRHRNNISFRRLTFRFIELIRKIISNAAKK